MLIQNIKVAADAMVFNKHGEHLQLLLVRRKYDPFKGLWALPGGFVEDNEEVEDAAVRELKEETGLELPPMKQLHTFAKVGRDPRGRTLSVTHYMILSGPPPPVTGGDDAVEAAWVNVADIKELAFDHIEVLEYGLNALKDKL